MGKSFQSSLIRLEGIIDKDRIFNPTSEEGWGFLIWEVNMRKRNGVILAVIGLILFYDMEGWGADWKFYMKSANGDHYIDAESITHPSKDTVRAWTKLIYSDKGVNNMVENPILGEKFKTLSYSMDLFECHCAERKLSFLSGTAYSRDGRVLVSVNYTHPEWRFIIPESEMDLLYTIVCK
jgi:hypothetical protein